MSEQPSSVEARNRRTLKKLLLWAVGMFAFAFLMVPLYGVICEVTGLNGKSSAGLPADPPDRVVTDRSVVVEFTTQTGKHMQGEFVAETASVRVHPGELTSVNFHANNPGSAMMVARAMPSVAPGKAARYVHKTRCFCFGPQKLLAGERKALPVHFYLDPDIPRHINQLTLSYTLFDVTERAEDNNSVAVR